ncbi:DUF177 domain-containing protein [Rhizobiaceae bacterium]|nr:DUF177 domain-containing protein [Rhizobiaceae bacterium]
MSDEPAFTYPVNVRTLAKLGRRERYIAETPVMVAIAAEYDLFGVSHFEATMLVQPWKSRGVRMEGTVRATVEQPCAATGEPLTQSVDEQFERLFVPEGSRLAKPQLDEAGEMVLDPEGDDAPEAFTGDSLDLAAVWLEHFGLGLDPFARADDVPKTQAAAAESRPSPFAALAALKVGKSDD